MALLMRRRTDYIVIHCSATGPNSDIGVDEITEWHKRRNFRTIGYQQVIRRDGQIEFGRHFDESGAHVKGHNFRSVGVCLVGGLDESGTPTDNFTPAQFAALSASVRFLRRAYPNAVVLGHRDLSPDINGDGVVTSDEWLKECPCFDVRQWMRDNDLADNF